jgi:hypothetical protein
MGRVSGGWMGWGAAGRGRMGWLSDVGWLGRLAVRAEA